MPAVGESDIREREHSGMRRQDSGRLVGIFFSSCMSGIHPLSLFTQFDQVSVVTLNRTMGDKRSHESVGNFGSLAFRNKKKRRHGIYMNNSFRERNRRKELLSKHKPPESK